MWQRRLQVIKEGRLLQYERTLIKRLRFNVQSLMKLSAEYHYVEPELTDLILQLTFRRRADRHTSHSLRVIRV